MSRVEALSLQPLVPRTCNFHFIEDAAWFNADIPGGEFTLDLQKPYDRSVMEDLLYLAASNDAVKIGAAKYSRVTEAGTLDQRDVKLELVAEVVDLRKTERFLMTEENLRVIFDRWGFGGWLVTRAGVVDVSRVSAFS
jgi:hypothetical protein